MIPKAIHYCWFGGNPIPEEYKKYIESWRKFCPDYEIIEWNETNFDLDICPYVAEAYKAKRWAFVSDYARFWILYNYGGLYFDTDVEMIKPIDDIIAKGAFMGCEPCTGRQIKHDKNTAVNPGLGLAAAPGLGLYKEILDYYDSEHFFNDDGTDNTQTVVERVTNILVSHGFKGTGVIEEIGEVFIYPNEYFCPIDPSTGSMNITDNTRTIHHYSASWYTPLERIITDIERKFSRGNGLQFKFGRLLSLPFRVLNKIAHRINANKA